MITISLYIFYKVHLGQLLHNLKLSYTFSRYISVNKCIFTTINQIHVVIHFIQIVDFSRPLWGFFVWFSVRLCVCFFFVGCFRFFLIARCFDRFPVSADCAYINTKRFITLEHLTKTLSQYNLSINMKQHWLIKTHALNKLENKEYFCEVETLFNTIFYIHFT